MSDMAAFQDSFKDSSTNEGNSLNVPLSENTSMGEDAAHSSVVEPLPVYGPAPKPVAQPIIFDRIYRHSEVEPSRQASPSFNLSARQSASVDSSNSPLIGGEQSSQGSETNGVAESPVGQSGTAAGSFPQGEPAMGDVEVTTTIAVESQCDSPSLNDIAETDISEASREELMVYHSELMGWIRELEQALQACQADFKAHLQQYGQQEELLEQRTQELIALQERYGLLAQEVDVQQKAHQRQTILVETLQEQLDGSQDRVAQMERDFSQVQRRCSDQANQLLQAEGLCRDLKSRLSRQQRHTMQFKAALEKSLAVSVNDGDYDLGDVDLDSMDSSGEIFPRSKPVQPWSNQLDEAALSQAFNGVEQSEIVPRPAVAKGLNLQLAFEDPVFTDLKAAQAKEAAKAQMAYGSASMGLAASQVNAMGDPAETVFDPERAEDLEATLKQESESILQGELLGGFASENAVKDDFGAQAPLVSSHGVAFVPPITPVLPEENSEQQVDGGAGDGTGPVEDAAVAHASDEEPEVKVPEVKVPEVKVPEVKATTEKKQATLAGISLPSFPKF